MIQPPGTLGVLAAVAASRAEGTRVGVGGWTYGPWRGNFFPKGLPRSRKLAYASRQLTTIEVNATFYGTLKPASFKNWHDESPDGFVFSLKAPRYATHRRVLADAGESIARFVQSGVSELGQKLGPIVWQFMPGKAFEPQDFEAFLALLPPSVDGQPLRHVADVRHESFMTLEYLALARRYRVATVFTDAEKYPSFGDLTGDFVYARLMQSEAPIATGYADEALDAWADRARLWAVGSAPADLPSLEAPAEGCAPRDVFIYFINGAKERAPHAAIALLSRLGSEKAGGASAWVATTPCK